MTSKGIFAVVFAVVKAISDFVRKL